MQLMRIRRQHVALGVTLAAIAATPAVAQAAGPSLDGLRLQERRLALTLDCSGRVNVRRGHDTTAACRDGRARIVLSLSKAQAQSLRDGKMVQLSVRVADRDGARVLPITLSLPVRGTAVARTATGGYWPTVEGIYDGAKGMCVATDRSDWSGQPGIRQVIIESNYARFGYRYGTSLKWTAWLEAYDPRTGVLSWLQGYTYWHTAGGGRGAAAVFNIANRPQYVRPAVQIVGGDWNYAWLETVAGKAERYTSSPQWCYMPVTA
jgi:hypothetical protein